MKHLNCRDRQKCLPTLLNSTVSYTPLTTIDRDKERRIANIDRGLPKPKAPGKLSREEPNCIGLMMTASACLRLPPEVVPLHQATEGESLVESRLQYRRFHAERRVLVHRRDSLLLSPAEALRSATTTFSHRSRVDSLHPSRRFPNITIIAVMHATCLESRHGETAVIAEISEWKSARDLERPVHLHNRRPVLLNDQDLAGAGCSLEISAAG